MPQAASINTNCHELIFNLPQNHHPLNCLTISSSNQADIMIETDDDEDDEEISNHQSRLDELSLSTLEPKQMVNDHVIEEYLEHLHKNMPPEKRNRINIMSTFFFTRFKRTIRTATVEKWRKHIKMFEKDYLVVPICDNSHWLLAIVCFAHQVNSRDEPIVIDEIICPSTSRTSLAGLLMFDSLGYKYFNKFTEPIRGFLTERWKIERPDEDVQNFRSRQVLPDYLAKVPRQRNSFDCGVYLLHYFEKFFEKPEEYYTKFRNNADLRFQWSINPKDKREVIKNILCNRINQ